VREDAQLAALVSIDGLLAARGIEYWLFGGWAVDFHAGQVSRPHDDLDLAVWLKDHDRIAALLQTDGWGHAPEEGEDGYTVYERDDVRLELAFLARAKNGDIYTPLQGRPWQMARRIVRRRRRGASRCSRPSDRPSRAQD
jgi:hypothetical protein